MPENKYAVITIRKPVNDSDQAKDIFNEVKELLSDVPDLEITGHYSNHFLIEEPE